MYRRRLLASIGSASALGALAGCAALGDAGGRDGNANTVAPDLRGTPTATPGPPGPTRWRTALAGVERTALTGGTAVALTVGGSAEGSASSVVAFDAATGERRWRRGVPLAAGLAAAGDRVYAGNWSWFRAYDARSGEELWRVDGAPFPLVVEGGAFSTGQAGAALRDPADGTVRWRRDPPTDGDLPYPVAAIGGTLALVGEDGTVEGVDVDTGERRFRIRAAGALTPFLAAYDDRRLYVGTDTTAETARVVGVDVAAGERLFAVTPGGYLAAPKLGGETVYVANRGREYVALRAREADTGAVRWRRDAAVDAAGPTGAFDLAGEELSAFDAADGATRWCARPAAGAPGDVTPLVHGAALVVVGPEGVVVYDAATGEERGRVSPDRDFAPRRAAVGGGTLLVPTDETLYAVGVRSERDPNADPGPVTP